MIILPKAIRKLKKPRTTKFFILKDVLHRGSLDDILLRCITNQEIRQAMSKMHSCTCGAYQPRLKLYMQLKVSGNYRPTIIANCINSRNNIRCQYHKKFIVDPYMLPPIRDHLQPGVSIMSGHSKKLLLEGISTY